MQIAFLLHGLAVGVKAFEQACAPPFGESGAAEHRARRVVVRGRAGGLVVVVGFGHGGLAVGKIQADGASLVGQGLGSAALGRAAIAGQHAVLVLLVGQQLAGGVVAAHVAVLLAALVLLHKFHLAVGEVRRPLAFLVAAAVRALLAQLAAGVVRQPFAAVLAVTELAHAVGLAVGEGGAEGSVATAAELLGDGFHAAIGPIPGGQATVVVAAQPTAEVGFAIRIRHHVFLAVGLEGNVGQHLPGRVERGNMAQLAELELALLGGLTAGLVAAARTIEITFEKLVFLAQAAIGVKILPLAVALAGQVVALQRRLPVEAELLE